ncbi:hypothetical protein MAPG_01168 [Magnaporthiopsis poae ATCC 64411]|uniref:Uncharacterized protein n=1 Tax=Magnaporthiopsis poae (strain ATCC 64411 / 73-15) TaxID=644358 RepID=A0A0C4DMZ8_MAGP6|nr:hypothetical protein MAPG_01168 [Magnaporthiopsis poae ATCC 64411]
MPCLSPFDDRTSEETYLNSAAGCPTEGRHLQPAPYLISWMDPTCVASMMRETAFYAARPPTHLPSSDPRWEIMDGLCSAREHHSPYHTPPRVSGSDLNNDGAVYLPVQRPVNPARAPAGTNKQPQQHILLNAPRFHPVAPGSGTPSPLEN